MDNTVGLTKRDWLVFNISLILLNYNGDSSG